MAVTVYHEHIVRNIINQINLLALQHIFIHINCLIQLNTDVNFLDVELEPSALQTGKVQQLLHHLRQPVTLLLDDAQTEHDLLRIACARPDQRFRPAADGGQRRAQLMRNR